MVILRACHAMQARMIRRMSVLQHEHAVGPAYAAAAVQQIAARNRSSHTGGT